MDLLILIVAVVFAFPMVYGAWAQRKAAQGVVVPPFSALVAAAWAVVGPILGVFGYVLKRLFAYGWKPSEDEKPALLRAERAQVHHYADELEPEPDEEPETPAPADSPLERRRDREAVVVTLVAAGWKVGEVRAVLKGDNGVIGEEYARARALIFPHEQEPEPAGRAIPYRHYGRVDYVKLPERETA